MASVVTVIDTHGCGQQERPVILKAFICKKKMRRFSNLTSAFYLVGRGKIPRGQSGLGERLTNHRHHLVLKLGIGGVKILLPLYALLAYKGKKFYFSYFTLVLSTFLNPVANTCTMCSYSSHTNTCHSLPEHCNYVRLDFSHYAERNYSCEL